MIYRLLGVERQRYISPFREQTSHFLSLFLLIQPVLLVLTLWVNHNVPQPYMDQIFHLDQLEHYLQGDFSYYHPKLTTPPGLYLLCYFPVRYLTSLLGISVLSAARLTNALLFPNLSLFFLNQVFCKLSPMSRPLLKTVALLLTPTLFFYNFLFYTDGASLCLLIMALYFTLIGSRFRLFATGLAAILVRQPNALWLVYIAVADFLLFREKNIELSGNLVSSFFKLCWSDRNIILSRYLPHLLLTLTFALFCYSNQGVALGDRLNHEPQIHLAQLCYLAVHLSLCTPLSLKHTFQIVRLTLGRVMSNHNALATLLTLLGCLILVVEHFSYWHPFLLADNRHYLFYLYKDLFRHKWFTFLCVPFYALAHIWLFRLVVNSKRTLLNYLLLLIFSAGCLVPAGLVQLRYFTNPLLFYCLLVDEASRFKLPEIKTEPGILLSITLRVAGNALLLYVFVCLPFGEGGRFMF